MKQIFKLLNQKRCNSNIRIELQVARSVILISLMLLFTLPAAASNKKYILWESFEDIVAPGFPADWIVENTNADISQWETADAGGIPGRSQSIRYVGDPVKPADDWFFTPVLNLDPGIEYTLSFYGKVSTASVQKLGIFLGNAPQSAAMLTPIYNNASITNIEMQKFSVSFTVVISGIYHLGFHCYSNANQNQFYLDDILLSQPTTDLSLTFSLADELLNPGIIPSYGVNDTIEGYTIIENTSMQALVMNTSFNIGGSNDIRNELIYIVIPPDGDTLEYIIRAEPEPFATSRTFQNVEPGEIKGRVEDLQKLFLFTQTGNYTARVFYRSIYKSENYDVWLGELLSDPVNFIIE
jgi:hypothetical protein